MKHLIPIFLVLSSCANKDVYVPGTTKKPPVTNKAYICTHSSLGAQNFCNPFTAECSEQPADMYSCLASDSSEICTAAIPVDFSSYYSTTCKHVIWPNNVEIL